MNFLYEKQNVKDRVEIYIDLSIYIFEGVFEVFVKAIVENQMTYPQMIMYPHLSQRPHICVCVCVYEWGSFLGGSIPLQWLSEVQPLKNLSLSPSIVRRT